MKAKLKVENLLLYQESLISIDNQDINDYNVIGDFGKKILIITDDFKTESEEDTLLDKMLLATGLGHTDIYHLKVATKSNLLPYINKIKPEKIICFGAQLDTHATRFSSRLYSVSQINDIQVLIVHNLNKIISSEDAKKALWNSLKKLLNL